MVYHSHTADILKESHYRLMQGLFKKKHMYYSTQLWCAP